MSELATSTANWLPKVWLDGVSLIAPGIENWAHGAEILRSSQPYQPAATLLPIPELLPAAERRRSTRPVKLCLALGVQACEQAGASPARLPSIFCSSGADGQTTHAICDTLSSAERMVSPTRFHNSVQNAAAGYWSIAVQCMEPSQVLCAYDATFAAGLLEAVVQVNVRQTAVLLMAYDGEYPEPLSFSRAIPDIAGIGLVISPAQTERSVASLSVSLNPAADQDDGIERGSVTPSWLAGGVADLTLANLGTQIPALAGLSILGLLAKRASGIASLPYLSGQRIEVAVELCQP